MPRHDARLRLEDRLTPRELLLMRTMVALLNEIRLELGLDVIDDDTVLAHYRLLLDVPRTEEGG